MTLRINPLIGSIKIANIIDSLSVDRTLKSTGIETVVTDKSTPSKGLSNIYRAC